VTELRSRGIQPDAVVLRSEEPIDTALREKISRLCDVELSGVVNAPDASNLYEIPLILHDEGLDRYVCEILGLANLEPDLASWSALVDRIEGATSKVRVGVIGKYVSLPDAYLSVVEALRHGGYHHGAEIDIDWIQAEEIEGLLAGGRLAHLDGMVIPGGFGERGIEGKIAAARYARENEVPCLGICLGLQVMVAEFCRNELGLVGANSREFDPTTSHPVVDLMDSQRDVTDMGGTMRLGLYPARLLDDSRVAAMYGDSLIYERHRHRYEVNNDYRVPMEEQGLRCSGLSPDGRLVEFIELDAHPFWVGTQAHPEFKSRPDRPAPLFRGLIGAALARSEGRNPKLLESHTESVD
jgi:CTP synthase